MEYNLIIGALSLTIIISVVIMAVLLYNFMQLLSTLNKRLIAVISDILENIDLSTPRTDSLVGDTPQIQLEDVLNDSEDEEGPGFNPHNFDPFKEDNE